MLYGSIITSEQLRICAVFSIELWEAAMDSLRKRLCDHNWRVGYIKSTWVTQATCNLPCNVPYWFSSCKLPRKEAASLNQLLHSHFSCSHTIPIDFLLANFPDFLIDFWESVRQCWPQKYHKNKEDHVITKVQCWCWTVAI